MLNKLKKSNREGFTIPASQKGFTIIEVMIVLAIAGLIILIVLLAVPALQRNGRNTAIKNDASAVAAGITEYASNNDGAIPDSVDGTGTVIIKKGTTDPGQTTAKVQGNTKVTTVTAQPGSGSGSTAVATTPAGEVQVYLKHKCNDTATNTRAVAVYYVTETNSTTRQQCLDT